MKKQLKSEENQIQNELNNIGGKSNLIDNSKNFYEEKDLNNVQERDTRVITMLLAIVVISFLIPHLIYVENTVSEKQLGSYPTSTFYSTIQTSIIHEGLFNNTASDFGAQASVADNKLINIDVCSQSIVREPNVKVDIGYGNRAYYGYTNEYGQLVYVTADSLQLQNSNTEQLIDGQYCNTQTNESNTSDEYNSGHAIGDELGGVSNSYNLFPQLTEMNNGKFKELEQHIESAMYQGSEVTDLRIEISYSSPEDTIPYSYEISFKIDNTEESYIFTN